MNALAVKCAQVKKSFTVRRQHRTILNDLSLTVGKGEVVTLCGKSGAGKSTLLSLIAGLDKPDSGAIILFDKDIRMVHESDLARLRKEHIGIVFQSHNLIPAWSAVENVEAALAHRGLSQTEMRKQASALLQTLGLENLEHHLPVELSAGERQRVAFARALVHTPHLILADEPGADIDPETGAILLALLLKSAKEHETAVIYATHGEPPAGFDNRVLLLENGTLRDMSKIQGTESGIT
jgi:ABC-type lipoprotein export system ATPase subunit